MANANSQAPSGNPSRNLGRYANGEVWVSFSRRRRVGVRYGYISIGHHATQLGCVMRDAGGGIKGYEANSRETP